MIYVISVNDKPLQAVSDEIEANQRFKEYKNAYKNYASVTINPIELDPNKIEIEHYFISQIDITNKKTTKFQRPIPKDIKSTEDNLNKIRMDNIVNSVASNKRVIALTRFLTGYSTTSQEIADKNAEDKCELLHKLVQDNGYQLDQFGYAVKMEE